VVVYDITDHRSFTSVNKWISELREFGAEDAVVMLVGNKSDLVDHREVFLPEARRFAVTNKYAFIETSALHGKGVDLAFSKVAEEINRRERKKNTFANSTSKPPSASKPIHLSSDPDRPKKDKCC